MLPIVAACLLSSPALPVAKGFEVRIDPRVELVTTVFRLAGAWEFKMDGAESPYSKSLDAYFAPYKDHLAVRLARRLREKSGIGFDAVTSLAVHLTDIDTLGERVPFDRPPARWDARWSAADARTFVRQLKAFVKDTHYKEFWAQQQPYLARATGGMTDLLKKYDISRWLGDFYGSPPGRRPFVIVGMLCGGGNYGMSVELPDGSLEMSPIFGASKFDAQGIPVYDESTLPTIIHEFSHSYVNPLARGHAAALKPIIAKFMPRLGPVFAANAYRSEETVAYETFVRAAESYLMRRHLSPELAEQSLIEQRYRNFLWTSDLVDELARYDENRRKYPKFADFFPQLVKAFERVTRDPEALYARCPQVTQCEFAPGEANEEDRLVTIKVRFDRPMRNVSQGISIEPRGWTIVSEPRILPDAQSAELTVKLKKGVSYDFYLNRFGGAFLSKDGYPVLPYQKKLTVE